MIYDIAIIGAGPAGCAAALGLGKRGLKTVLVDKAVFPRDKACGDAIPGPAISALSKAFPFFRKEFTGLSERQRITSSRIMLWNGRSIDYKWTLPAYNIRREIFDAFLLQLVKKYTDTDVLEGWPVEKVIPGKPQLIRSVDRSISARLIIACDGVNSLTAGSLQHAAPFTGNKVFAVRAYYKNIELNSVTNFFFVDRKLFPGYFWVFPLPGDLYNVGFGIKTGADGRPPASMKASLHDFITADKMKKFFSGAEQVSEVKGGLIPAGRKRSSYSGEGYLLAGDAAGLADPLQGNGIDKAVVSGLLAAHHCLKCLVEDEFGATHDPGYDLMLRKGIEKELRKNRNRLIIISNFPFLLNLYSRIK
jgi:geranylgeranyl reductase family protein